MYLQEKRKDCTEGCQCLNCTNRASHIHENTNIDKVVVKETYLERNDDEDIDEIIDGIFGPGEESDACSSVSWTDDEDDISVYNCTKLCRCT